MVLLTKNNPYKKEGFLHEQHITRRRLPAIHSYVCQPLRCHESFQKVSLLPPICLPFAVELDGTLESLLPHSRRLHSHPNQHTDQETRLIRRVYGHHRHDGIVVRWIYLRRKDYTRTLSSLYTCMRRLVLYRKKLQVPDTPAGGSVSILSEIV